MDANYEENVCAERRRGIGIFLIIINSRATAELWEHLFLQFVRFYSYGDVELWSAAGNYNVFKKYNFV